MAFDAQLQNTDYTANMPPLPPIVRGRRWERDPVPEALDFSSCYAIFCITVSTFGLLAVQAFVSRQERLAELEAPVVRAYPVLENYRVTPLILNRQTGLTRK